MPVEKRSYGQGAQGELVAQASAKKSLSARLRYGFDNAITHTSSFFAILIGGSIVLAILITALSYLNGDNPVQDPRWIQKPVFFDRLWFVFTQIVIGGGKPDGSGLDRIITIMLWASATIFTAFLFAFVTNKMFVILGKLQEGRSNVTVSNHTLIIGWSNRVFALLRELNTASEGTKATVVLISRNNRSQMENEIEDRVGKLKNLKLVTRTGDSNNPEDLRRVNVAGAKSIIVLDSQLGDADVVAAVLSITAAGAANVPVVAEVDDAIIGQSLRVASNNRVIPVRSDEIIARVTAQASRQVGLAAVVLDLLDFVGDEIYFTNVPALTGKTYAEALVSFNDSSVIGIHSKNGETLLNPARTVKIADGDRLIVVAEDDTKVTYTGVRDDLLDRKSKNGVSIAAKPNNLLISGWSSMGDAVLTELAALMPKGSSVHVVYNESLVPANSLKGKKWGNLKFTHKTISGSVSEFTGVTKNQKFDEIIVLGYRENISQGDADAHTMLTMLQLNQLKLKASNGEATRLIAEILDSRRADLARVAAEGDLVISDHLAALLIAPLSQNPSLAPIYDELFGSGGASILINPIQNYVAIGETTTFADMVAAASDRGESAIGYRVGNYTEHDGSTGVTVNPNKNDRFTPTAADSLVVIGRLS